MRFFFRALALSLLTAPGLAFAQQNVWCAYVPCGAGGGAAGFSAYMHGIGMELVTMLGGLVGGYLLVAAFTMVTESRNEGLSEGKEALRTIAVGSIVVVLATSIVAAFGTNGGNPGAVGPLESNLELIVTTVRKTLYIAVMANLVIQAFRMISSGGEEGQFDKAKQRLFVGFAGVGVVLLADVIVSAAALRISAGGVALQIVGVANYLITIFGGLAVIAVLVSGILLVASVDESLKEKSKAALKVAFYTLIAVLFSAAIIRFFFANTPQ